ncbi:MAG: site-2 protease family protein [Planctomycetota bacterium]
MKLMRLLDWSFSVGRIFGIVVKLHFLFLGYVVYELIDGGDLVLSIKWLSLLFLSVLLHEFGHCFGARRVGGEANEVLLWPLGGLAYTSPPDTPWAHFVTVVCGPLVNLLLAVAAYILLLFAADGPVVGFNPLSIWVGPADGLLQELLAFTFAINYYLLLFNLVLVFYPFDGGRLVQIVMWRRMGYGKSSYLAAKIGIGGAIVIALFGLFGGQRLLFFIAIFGLFRCLQRLQMLKYEAISGYGPDPVLEAIQRQSQPSRAELKKEKKLLKKQNQEREYRAEVDRILTKVSEQGLQSLSKREKKILQQDTDRLNQ